jgi:hypothetical protein
MRPEADLIQKGSTDQAHSASEEGALAGASNSSQPGAVTPLEAWPESPTSGGIEKGDLADSGLIRRGDETARAGSKSLAEQGFLAGHTFISHSATECRSEADSEFKLVEQASDAGSDVWSHSIFIYLFLAGLTGLMAYLLKLII